MNSIIVEGDEATYTITFKDGTAIANISYINPLFNTKDYPMPTTMEFVNKKHAYMWIDEHETYLNVMGTIVEFSVTHTIGRNTCIDKESYERLARRLVEKYKIVK